MVAHVPHVSHLSLKETKKIIGNFDKFGTLTNLIKDPLSRELVFLEK